MNKENLIVLVLMPICFVLSLYVEFLFINSSEANFVYAVNMAWATLYIYLVAYILNSNSRGGGKRQKEIVNNFIYGYTYYCSYIFIILLCKRICCNYNS